MNDAACISCSDFSREATALSQSRECPSPQSRWVMLVVLVLGTSACMALNEGV